MKQAEHGQAAGATDQRRNVYLIADDDEFFRVALKTILLKQLDGNEVIETGSLDEAIERLSQAGQVDLAIFDLAMPGMTSAASMRAVRESFPGTKVAVVSASNRREDILLALEAGVHGYIPKGLGVTELSRALKLVCDGVVYVPQSVTQLGSSGQAPAQPRPKRAARTDVGPDMSLTPRQQEVLALLVQGWSNKQIARALNLGEGTVKVHVAALFRVLGVTSRSAVAAAGARLRKT